jgi:hypothetical protein
MGKPIHFHILFALFVFTFSLAFSAAEYVQCKHHLPDEMLDHAALTGQPGKGSPDLPLFMVPFPFPGLTVNLSFQGFPPSRSFDSSVHSKTILSTVIRI